MQHAATLCIDGDLPQRVRANRLAAVALTSSADIATTVKRLARGAPGQASCGAKMTRAEPARPAEADARRERERSSPTRCANDLGKSPVEALPDRDRFHDQRGRPRARQPAVVDEADQGQAAAHVPTGLGHGSCRQPLGMVLIIAPWNYPLQLTARPARRRPGRRQHGRHQAVRAGAGDVDSAGRAGPAVSRRTRRGRRRGRGRRDDRRCSPNSSTTSSTPAAATSAGS